MVIMTMIDLTLGLSIWTVKKVYNVSHWMIWGNVKSDSDILIEKLNENIELLNFKLETLESKLK